MSHRFFVPPENWKPAIEELGGPEARHAADVLRLRAGEEIVLFDGRGRRQVARIERVERGALRLLPLREEMTSPLSCRIALGQAIPKGRNMDLVVQKATELGASALYPLVTDHTIVRLDAADGKAKQEKWSRVAIEACKQCGQDYPPEVSEPMSMQSLLAGPAGSYQLVLIASLQPGARTIRDVLAETRRDSGRDPAAVLVLIGPEGDFTADEVAAALAAGARPVTLGPIVLRTETAAMYCLSVLSHELQR